MTRPKITWQESGSAIELAMLGETCVGRVFKGYQGGKPSWMTHLPNKTGTTFCNWRDEKTVLAAKNSLISAIRDWLRTANLTTAQGN